MVLRVFAVISLLLTGAIFGFFYAWICSTIWGLNMLSPDAAIEAMNAMNASVRNIVFFPAFFLTPVALIAVASGAYFSGSIRSGRLFLAAALIYVFGAFMPTALVNVPMNEALANMSIILNPARSDAVWQAYSERWQLWNIIRTVGSGLSLACVGFALICL